MALHYGNLDARTRALMLEELAQDAASGTLYLSPRLSGRGRADYEALLREAIADQDDDWLAAALRANGRLNPTEARRKPSGGYTVASMSANAHHILAEGEFNRFYVRAICRRAVEDGIPQVVVYRAKPAASPRPESQAMIGKAVDPQALLSDLQTHQGVDTALHLPPGPNSGLSIRLP